MHPDRPVPLIVEHEDHDPKAFANRGLELGHRHRKAAIAGQGDDRPIVMNERCGDRGRDPVAHRARCRAEECPRPAEREPAGQPAREVPGIGREDCLGRQDAVERRDDAPRMNAGPLPLPGVDHAGRLERRSVRFVRRSPLVEAILVVDRAGQHPGGEPQEGSRIGRQRHGRRRKPAAPRSGFEIDVGPSLTLGRNAVLAARRLVQPGTDDEDLVRFGKSVTDRRRRSKPGHPEVERVFVGEDVAAAPRGDDRDFDDLGESDEVTRRPGAKHPGACEDDRSLGRREAAEDGPHDIGIGLGRPSPLDGEHVGVQWHRLVEQILG